MRGALAAKLPRVKGHIPGVTYNCHRGKRRAEKKVRQPIAFPPPGRCVFPRGDPGESGFGFCAAKAEPGKPYCAACCQIAYRQTMMWE